MLYTSQIQEFGKCYIPNWTGVYAHDQLPAITKLPAAIIANTDPINRPGEHWTAIHIDRNNFGYFYDSYGFPPDFYGFKDYMMRFCKHITFNPEQFQCLDSTVCGHHSLYFLTNYPKLYYKKHCNVNDRIVKLFYDKLAANCVCTGQKCLPFRSEH